ncbi:hypothetical protein [Bacillus sp. V33-4]|uniref:hypothetical protein n=1 Tax=Bacillus sp. V33-4 TaxID=2054169 RepID=UPI000C75EE73|nr:hypothetical protein [Bacillus sp. V33-4]PLR87592.1 hypothetical protein CVD23_01590 [Bacillus sp. V33-4]
MKTKDGPFFRGNVPAEYRETEQLKAKPGIWVNGKMYWVDSGYEKLIPEQLLSIKMNRHHPHSKIRFYDMYVTNHSLEPTEIKVLMMHSYENATKDHVTFISPVKKVIFHLTEDHVFLINGHYNGEPMEESTVQPLWNIGSEAFWSCAEKGRLRYQPMAKGLAVSIFSLSLKLAARQTVTANAWMMKGSSQDELFYFNQAVLKNRLAFPCK